MEKEHVATRHLPVRGFGDLSEERKKKMLELYSL